MNEDTPRGFAFAIAAFAIWGMLPFYFRALGHVPTPEVVAHRVIWALPVALGWLLYLGPHGGSAAGHPHPAHAGHGGGHGLADFHKLGQLCLAHPVGAGDAGGARLLHQPHFQHIPGRDLLGERLSARQWGAVALAFAAVVVLTIEAGSLPMGALAIVFSWGGYAYFKRALPIGPNQGFALEALILLPAALGFMAWLALQGRLFALQASGTDWLLLLGCGFITATPLILYANAAKGLRLSTIAISRAIPSRP